MLFWEDADYSQPFSADDISKYPPEWEYVLPKFLLSLFVEIN